MATLDSVIEGKVVTHEGIECELRKSPFSSQTDAFPTKKGQRTERYQSQRHEFGDHWFFSFDLLPDDVLEQLMQHEDVRAFCDSLS